MQELVIAGRGVISPIGNNIQDFEAGLDAGTIPFVPTPWTDPDKGMYGWMSPVKDFTATDWMTDRVCEGTNLTVQYGIAAAVQAVEESGVELDPLRTSITVGTSGVATPLAEAQEALDLKGPDAVPPKLTLPAYLFFCASQLAMRWGLHAPIMTLDHACAAGIDAIGQGGRLIEMGDADVVIAVGTHGPMPGVLRFSSYGPPRKGAADDMEAGQ